MKRREFLEHTLTAAAAVAIGSARVAAQSTAPRVALTFDDFLFQTFGPLPAAPRNAAILAALDARGLKAGAFVTGRHVQEARAWHLVEQWNEAGHLIGNHTYSHLWYSKTPFAEFSRDVERGEVRLRQLSQFQRLLRFPYLDEGATAAQRDAMRAYLTKSGYRNAHVTIDTSDWEIDERLRAHLTKQPRADVTPFRTEYLNHIWERAQFNDNLARQVLGRRPPYVMLLHHNVLNAKFLGDLLDLFTRKGWQLIDPREAYRDPIYNATPMVVPAGSGLIESLARERGR